jgi:LacI family transcriptional regulator
MAEVPAVATAGKLKRVALLVETSGSYGRGLLRGIAQYNRDRGNWSTYFRPHGLDDPPPTWIKRWKGDGLLVRVGSQPLADVVRRLGIPTVNLRSAVPDLPMPCVAVDDEVVADHAARHLLERGLREFAFVGRSVGANPSLDRRREAFARRIRSERDGTFNCHLYVPPAGGSRESWEAEQDHLAKWLGKLPKPIGVMACNDERGLQVLDAARRCGCAVPDEVAVIGVDNDPCLCELSIPPLTSVDINAEAIGYEAAALLDRMMSGEPTPAKQVWLPPRGVVTRRSTDVVASEDEDVRRAIRFIREHACRGLQTGDVLMHLGVSRSLLQQRMKQLTGRTIHGEIQHARLKRAQDLLVGSELTIKQVARESGFASVQYMTRVFHDVIGETPAKYRNTRTVRHIARNA